MGGANSMKYFHNCHPVVMFSYLIGVIFITMFTMNPIFIGISFLCSISFTFMLFGARETVKSLLLAMPMIIIIALTNPLFVHKGETVLFFLNNNPMTLEAMIYGLFAALMLVSVFYWFKCYNRLMTSDKFIYLFGQVIPKLALMLSMMLNFVPKFIKQFKAVDESQKAMGIYSGSSYTDKIKCKFRVLSSLITWSLENSIETADSMKARGYGLKGRTSYSVFAWKTSDKLLMSYFGVMIIIVTVGLFTGYADFDYYPKITRMSFEIIPILLYFGGFILMFTSTIMEIKENMLWHYLKSKI